MEELRDGEKLDGTNPDPIATRRLCSNDLKCTSQQFCVESMRGEDVPTKRNRRHVTVARLCSPRSMCTYGRVNKKGPGEFWKFSNFVFLHDELDPLV